MENDERLKDSETTPQLMLTRILYFHFLNVKHPFLHKKTVVFIFKLNSTINIPCRRPNFVLCKSLKSINVTHIFPFTVSNLPPNKHVYSLVLIWQNRELVCRPSEHDVRSTPYHRWLPERTSKMRDERWENGGVSTRQTVQTTANRASLPESKPLGGCCICSCNCNIWYRWFGIFSRCYMNKVEKASSYFSNTLQRLTSFKLLVNTLI